MEDSRCVAADCGTRDPVIEFLSLLLDQVEIGVDMASKKPLEAAMSHPIQGTFVLHHPCSTYAKKGIFPHTPPVAHTVHTTYARSPKSNPPSVRMYYMDNG